ncbi:hypothetical protein [Vulcanisaeta sp.]|jgi:hypothetical protein|uniref:hypothetical protein n=1 Tax=Vulcanisaeta sp. TaxID=2020871 RepID=UPI003D105E73
MTIEIINNEKYQVNMTMNKPTFIPALSINDLNPLSIGNFIMTLSTIYDRYIINKDRSIG